MKVTGSVDVGIIKEEGLWNLQSFFTQHKILALLCNTEFN